MRPRNHISTTSKVENNYLVWELIQATFHRVKDKLAAKSKKAILESDYFTFTVVMHPFDRVLSAFRDRILGGCTYQAKTHIPRILRGTKLKYDKKGCVESPLPKFRQFVEYILSKKGKDADPHWLRYSVACAPCLVKYDAIIKLETSDEDEVIQETIYFL